MAKKLDPFKIQLLIPTIEDLRGLKPVKVMDIMEGFTKNFHPDGMFSAEIFNKVGTEARNKTFAYIDLNVPIFHPLIYKCLIDLKGLYEDIMTGRAYAVFDETLKDFVVSNIAEGETGYHFFVKHFPKLDIPKRNSISRDTYIDFINMHKGNAFIKQLVILPAGLRDYTVDEDGKPSEDEINAMYRSIMAVASTMENLTTSKNPEFVDTSRANLQTKVLDLYRYIIGLLLGKHKMVQGSFLSRKVSNTTRNVITAYVPNITKYGDHNSVGPTTVVLGMYQHMRNLMPLIVHVVRTKYMQDVFSGSSTDMTVVDPKTLKSKRRPIDTREYNRWMTYDGIEKVCDQFSQESMRHYPIMIGEDYLGLVYRGPDDTFKFLQDIDDVPEGRDKKHVTPITMAEFLYMCTYEAADDSMGYSTRYPVTTFGSTFPCLFFMRSTIRSEARTELGYDWNPTGKVARAFPITGLPFFNSMSIPAAKLARTGAD